ncbi:hypothetical protein BOTBODRAFT_29408 [Botryobasidium botryosum FD-172 SS1]|uniref:Uncharacterized protein n=1 Tax=Botryobasidium botryosum (strain FD-172 SS1) TaxID=930990 RepID=A0A067N1Q7_BOTB1|nr:hypothetical protein BOTBODRAFT_29408 [Botryobasidium botryosum FD-172 SS1]
MDFSSSLMKALGVFRSRRAKSNARSAARSNFTIPRIIITSPSGETKTLSTPLIPRSPKFTKHESTSAIFTPPNVLAEPVTWETTAEQMPDPLQEVVAPVRDEERSPGEAVDVPSAASPFTEYTTVIDSALAHESASYILPLELDDIGSSITAYFMEDEYLEDREEGKEGRRGYAKSEMKEDTVSIGSSTTYSLDSPILAYNAEPGSRTAHRSKSQQQSLRQSPLAQHDSHNPPYSLPSSNLPPSLPELTFTPSKQLNDQMSYLFSASDLQSLLSFDSESFAPPATASSPDIAKRANTSAPSRLPPRPTTSPTIGRQTKPTTGTTRIPFSARVLELGEKQAGGPGEQSRGWTRSLGRDRKLSSVV